MLSTASSLRTYLRNHYVLMAVLAIGLLATQLVEGWAIQGDTIGLGLGVVGGIRLETTFWAIKTVTFIALGSILVATVAQQVAKRFGVSNGEQHRIFWGFFFASPWIIGFVIFVLGPALASLLLSLIPKYKLGDPLAIDSLTDFVNRIDFDNYRKFLAGEGAHGRRFQQAMFNSFYYAIVGVPLQIFAALTMAILLNQALKGIRVFRLIFYMPVILAGGPAILLAWRYMLTSNGGFVNEAARGVADKFFLFDWVYRGFIYVVEGFNGFYIGLTRGDPIGPFKYTIPAFIGVLVLLSLALGYGEPGKRRRAQRAAEMVSVVLVASLLTKGLSTDFIDVSWIYISAAVAIFGITLNHRSGKLSSVRVWQYGTIGLFIFALFLLLAREWSDKSPYVVAILVAVLPLIYSRLGKWTKQKTRILAAFAIFFSLIVLVRIVPDQLTGGRPWIVPRYMVMTSGLEAPDSEEYLEDVFPVDTLSSLWIYGAVVVVLTSVVIIDDKKPRARRYLVRGSLVFFGLLMIGSFVDGVRYFDAFGDIADATGAQNFHFSRFHNTIADFPDTNRVPLWMTSELWSKSSLILITMWSSGAGMLIFLAALKGVPKSLYEAAEVDGANRIQKFFKITLPMISPAMFYNVVIGMIAALQTFEAVYILRTPENTDSLASAAYYLYERTFRQLAIGEGSAMSWILALIIVTLTVMQFRYSEWVHYEA